MKLYFHRQLVWPTLFFGGCAAIFIYKIRVDGYSIIDWMMLIASLAFVGIGLSAMWKHRRKKEVKLQSPRELKVEIGDTEIAFPEGYYFRQSQVDKERKVGRERITEINLYTLPPSFIIDDKEVIFVNSNTKDQLDEFGRRNSIPIVDRLDIWEYINRPFLDTEFEPPEQEYVLKKLANNGVSEEETRLIREKIKWTMSANFFAWEWIYLGQFDYLTWTTPLTQKKYWWSMGIALRNYNRKI